MPPIAAWQNNLRAEGSTPWECRTVPWDCSTALSGDSGGLPTGKNAQTRSLVSSAERVAPAIPLSHIPFRCFAISRGDLLLSRGWGVPSW